MENSERMIEFFTKLLGSVSQWLMSEPIIYFTGCFLGYAVIGLVYKLWHINRI